LAPDYQIQGIINRDHMDSNTPNFPRPVTVEYRCHTRFELVC
jgi:hypothetical protein